MSRSEPKKTGPPLARRPPAHALRFKPPSTFSGGRTTFWHCLWSTTSVGGLFINHRSVFSEHAVGHLAKQVVASRRTTSQLGQILHSCVIRWWWAV